VTRTLLFAAVLAASACAPQATPTLFVPPTGVPVLVSAATVAGLETATPRPTAAATPTLLLTPTPCTNDLKFAQDISVPDGTTLTPGEPVDKQWLVTNTGSCNWAAGYRLRLISGEAMGVPSEQALYPAVSGTQATLRIVFTAPPEAGSHQGAWQAFSPEGIAFGEAVYIQIVVSP
jgi:hypothetical protein